MSLDVHELNSFLLIGSAVVVAAIIAIRFTSLWGFPSLLIYLFIGIGLGEAGLGIEFDDPQAAYALGAAALVIILSEGGMSTRWDQIKGSMRIGVALATVGIAVSVSVVAAGAHYLLGMPWQTAVLLGAATSATDAAAVFSVLRTVPLPKRVSGALEAESGLNDAPTVVLVMLVSTSAGVAQGPWRMLGSVVFQLGGGVLIGFAVGWVGAWVMRRSALPSSGLYPLAAFALTVLAYGLGMAVETSGFAAVYVAAVVLGNADLPHRHATRSFVEGLGWLAQIALFVMLGLLLSPYEIDGDTVMTALLAGLILTFVARPISVAASSLVQRMPFNELAFMSWAGLRGAVPIVFATIPLAEGVRGAEHLFNVIFLLVVMYTLLTGPTLPLVAKVLRVARRSEPRDLDVEAAPLERIAADLVMVTVSPKSRLHGVAVSELRLPQGSSVSLLVRGGESLVPTPSTVIRKDDDMLVVVPRGRREECVRRLRQVSLGGRLAQWRGTRAPEPR